MAAKDTDDRKTDDQDAEISLDMSQAAVKKMIGDCLLYTSPSPRDRTRSRMPSSA